MEVVEPRESWWSPTSIARLLTCPASGTSSATPSRPEPSAPKNAGAVAHLALQFWVEAQDWRRETPGAALREHFDRVLATHGIEDASMPQLVATRARLKVRGGELAEVLARAGGTVHSELLLRDETEHLFGILDIAVVGGAGIIIDLKSGVGTATDLQEDSFHQLALYAHLYEVNYGAAPQRVSIFSLQRGFIDVPVGPDGLTKVLRLVRKAVESGDDVARPSDIACRFCRLRMQCQPHWEAARTWPTPDAVEGRVEKVEYSTSGKAAVRLADGWVMGIPETSLPASVEVGSLVRIVRVSSRAVESTMEWRFGSSSLITDVTGLGIGSDVGGP